MIITTTCMAPTTRDEAFSSPHFFSFCFKFDLSSRQQSAINSYQLLQSILADGVRGTEWLTMPSSYGNGFGPDKWGDDDWNTVMYLGTASGQDKSLMAVKAAFAFLLLVGVLGLSSFIFFLNRSRTDALKPMPLMATLAAMFSMVV